MAAQHSDIGSEAIAVGYIIVNLIAHNINDVLHFITFGLTTGYLLWRWRRDWRKEKSEQLKAHNDGKTVDQKEGN